ncbi:hypothetical protein TNCV_3507361 [Trichonephila clavipes]|uniref:Uncharacterized protein n=1 Tax=Trichonephila clavipes TaxID=2585209 RepID=A0A8X6S6F2_TRICX|nr:hypothetical protein TNCV_3507361 [Trichonephila clavipes]
MWTRYRSGYVLEFVAGCVVRSSSRAAEDSPNIREQYTLNLPSLKCPSIGLIWSLTHPRCCFWRTTSPSSDVMEGPPCRFDLIINLRLALKQYGAFSNGPCNLYHGQVTWMTPELEPSTPNFRTAPTGGL